MTSFSLTIGVYDSNGSSLESTRGEYVVSITISPSSGSLNTAGTTSITAVTSLGIKAFDNLRILSGGTFKLVVSSSGITSIDSWNIVVTNYAYSMNAVSSTLIPTVNFDFTITVDLKGEDNLAFLRSCTIALSDGLNPTTLAGENSLSTSTGTKAFTFYFTSSGTKTITASCSETSDGSALTQSIDLTANKLKLIITSFTPVNFM